MPPMTRLHGDCFGCVVVVVVVVVETRKTTMKES